VFIAQTQEVLAMTMDITRTNELSPEQVSTAFSYLGIDLSLTDSETSPEFMHKLLLEVGFSDEHISKIPILAELASRPIPLTPLLQNIYAGLAHNKPLANTIKSLPIASEIKDEQASTYFLHMTVLLEVLTFKMVNDAAFAEKMMDAILQARSFAPSPASNLNDFLSIWQTAKDFFYPMKFISVEPGIWWFRLCRQIIDEPNQAQAKQFIAEQNLSGLNTMLINSTKSEQPNGTKLKGLRLNIAEAYYAQPRQIPGGQENANSAVGLINDLENNCGPQKFTKARALPNYLPSKNSVHDFWSDLYANAADKDNVLYQISGMSREWQQLYTAWNMAFVIGKYQNMYHIVLPKLIIPSTLNADPDKYIATRAYSLWLLLNFFYHIQRKNLQIRMQPNVDLSAIFCEKLGVFSLKFAKDDLGLTSEVISEFANKHAVAQMLALQAGQDVTLQPETVDLINSIPNDNLQHNLLKLAAGGTGILTLATLPIWLFSLQCLSLFNAKGKEHISAEITKHKNFIIKSSLVAIALGANGSINLALNVLANLASWLKKSVLNSKVKITNSGILPMYKSISNPRVEEIDLSENTLKLDNFRLETPVSKSLTPI
jgi:hypothetical protein